MEKEVYVVMTGVKSFKYLSNEPSIKHRLTSDIDCAMTFEDKDEALQYINIPCFNNKVARVQKIKIRYEFID